MTTLADDFEFAKTSGEFTRAAPLLRYVVAINPQVTRSEFVAAAIAAGYDAGSAANRFRESRNFDRAEYGTQTNSEGVQIETQL